GLAGNNPNEQLDLARPMYQAVCDAIAAETNDALVCNMIDMKEAIITGSINYVETSGVQFTAAGVNLASQINGSFLIDHCIEQPMANTCCTALIDAAGRWRGSWAWDDTPRTVFTNLDVTITRTGAALVAPSVFTDIASTLTGTESGNHVEFRI